MPGPVGPDEVRRVAEAALDLPGADGVEVLFLHSWGGLTRFANSAIHQSTWREDTGVRVRAVVGGRVGVVSSNEFSPEGARRAAASALDLARVAAPDPLFPGLAPRQDVPQVPDPFDEATASASPEERAEAVAALVAEVGPGFHAAGALETSGAEVAVANTEGQFCYAPSSQATLTTVVSGGEGGAGAAEAAARRLGELDPTEVGRRAFQKARDSQNPQLLEPGTHEVVLEPLAVATLVGFLAYVGLRGRAIVEGRSPFSGKEGVKVCGENVSIWDDALSPLTIGLPFDFEGTPRRRVDLIRNGVFLTGAHDRRSARMAGTESTGHALPPPNPDGAFPLNLFLGTGEATLEEMVASTRRGLLVTRFHYTNVVHPIETTITGMTRDGTWLIEEGAVRYPVRNLRFTQSILEALSHVELVGRESVLASEFFFAASRVPALKVARFTFSSASDH
ncbi:MAG TPA: metallopeptidase TldD-related protein [Actinomycetota bacterium]|nr:metallopeptidase TldD-related protein [Actinomycetota bacterium]